METESRQGRAKTATLTTDTRGVTMAKPNINMRSQLRVYPSETPEQPEPPKWLTIAVQIAKWATVGFVATWWWIRHAELAQLLE